MEEPVYTIFIDAVEDSDLKSAGVGILILDKKNNVIVRISDFQENADINKGRTIAIHRSLKEMRKRDIRKFQICSDDEFIINQLQGLYKIRDPLLKQLKNVIKTKFHDVDISVKKIAYEENKEARALAKKGLEKLKSRGDFVSYPLSFLVDWQFSDKQKKPEADIQRSAGGVVYKKDGEKYKICIIAKRNFKVWALPKGRVGEGESPEETAIREVIEETGHLARIQAKIDEINYHFYWKDNHTLYHKFVYFYLMPLVSENAYPRDQEADDVRWVTIGEAYKVLTYINEKEIIRKARKILEQMQ